MHLVVEELEYYAGEVEDADGFQTRLKSKGRQLNGFLFFILNVLRLVEGRVDNHYDKFNEGDEVEDKLPEEGGLVLPPPPVVGLENGIFGVGEHAAEPVDQSPYVEHGLVVGLSRHTLSIRRGSCGN